MPREYATAEAFRRALEDRLNEAAKTELIQVSRLRRQVAFDRLLARLFRIDPAAWVLKGGYALELRFRSARATVDIDLTVQKIAAARQVDANQIVRDMLPATVLEIGLSTSLVRLRWIWMQRPMAEPDIPLKHAWTTGSFRGFIWTPGSGMW